MEISKISNEFTVDGSLISYKRLNGGNINLTYVVEYLSGNAAKAYVLQRINKQVFKNPDLVMQNVVAITEYIGSVNPDYPLKCIRTKRGGYYFVDDQGEFWRMYNFVEDTFSISELTNPEDFRNAAISFGNFQKLLADYPIDTLHETIPNFHNTPSRFNDLKIAIENNFSGRKEA